MNLNKEFKQAIIDNQYYYSAFDGKIHDINDLQVCHILSKSKRTLNSIKKAYGCDNKTAEMLMNMPLLNTVIGTRQDNSEYKKTDDIVFIDFRLCRYVYNLLIGVICEPIDIPIFNRYYTLLGAIVCEDNFSSCNNKLITDNFKQLQYQFHKEIDLHI